jgi:hypothetical protein
VAAASGVIPTTLISSIVSDANKGILDMNSKLIAQGRDFWRNGKVDSGIFKELVRLNAALVP